MGFFDKIFNRPPATLTAVNSETTQVMKKREKTVLTPEELEEMRNRPVGMQAFGYRRTDGMDNAYYNREEQERADLAEARKKIEGIK